MSSSAKENRRKCFKCGKSPASDNIKLFRFPKPATRNLLRCTMWAKYLFPSEEHTSVEFQKKLFSEHRMLCQDHFSVKDFTDSTKKRLLYSAVPCDIEQVSMVMPHFFNEPQPGTSQLCKAYGPSQGHAISKAFISQAVARTPLENISNTLECRKSNLEKNETSCTQEPKFETEKEKCLYNKCRKYVRQLCLLRNQLKNMKKKAILNILTDNNAVKKLEKKLTPTFAFLLQAQIRNSNKSTGCRWTKEEKIVALRLYKRSPTCYRLLRRMFNLPSPSTLKVLLNRMPFAVGIANPVLEVLSNYVQNQDPSDNHFILMFDEMSIKNILTIIEEKITLKDIKTMGPKEDLQM